jgi:hypothetical protein
VRFWRWIVRRRRSFALWGAEIGGVLLIAAASWHVERAIAPAVIGLYLIIVANLGGE